MFGCRIPEDVNFDANGKGIHFPAKAVAKLRVSEDPGLEQSLLSEILTQNLDFTGCCMQ